MILLTAHPSRASRRDRRAAFVPFASASIRDLTFQQQVGAEMGRNKDITTAGRSRLVPWFPNETDQERHERRLRTAMATRHKLEAWCDMNDLLLLVMDAGLHWKIDQPGFIAQWWPSTAKLVINKQWNNGIHVHDYEQVIAQIKKHLALSNGAVAAADASSKTRREN